MKCIQNLVRSSTIGRTDCISVDILANTTREKNRRGCGLVMTSLFLAGAGEKQSLICQEFEQAIENSSVLARVVETETANRNLQKSMIK